MNSCVLRCFRSLASSLVVCSREALRAALVAWLDQFADETERVLCFDYGCDWEPLCDLLDGSPAGWQAPPVGQLLDLGRQEDYYHEHQGRHLGLVDARAKRTHQVPRSNRKPPGTSCAGATLNNMSIPLGVAFRKNPPPP